MFYNRWLLLWALWLIYNGPHCGMLQETPPFARVCVHSCTAVVMCGVMETVVSEQCAPAADMPVWVYALIGKSRKTKGSRLQRSTSSVSPTAQSKDCLNLAPRSASWVTTRRPVRNCEMGSCFVERFSARRSGCKKAFFIWCTCALFLGKSEEGRGVCFV